MPARKQNCVWLYLKINKSTCINQKLARIPCKRYAGHIVARMKQHHKCMGRTALGCTAWAALHVAALHGAALHVAALHGVALHGSALNGVALRGTALHGTALHGVMALHGAACTVDGRKVGHFLITIQKFFKLIINQS